MPTARSRLSCAAFPRRRTLAGAAAALALLAGGSHAASAATNITLGAVSWIGYGPIYVAAAKGFFTQHGLHVSLVNFNDNAAMPGAVYGGQVTAATLTYDQVIGSDAKGWNLKVVMPIDYSAGADAIVSTDNITSVAQLKGLKVAYAPLSPSDFLLGYALKQAGLTKSDVTSVNVPADGVPGVMVGGSTKAGVTYDPSVTSIVQADNGKKFHVLFSSRQAPGLITDVLVMSPKFLKTDPAGVTDFIEAFVEGEAYMKSNPADAQAIIGQALGEGVGDVQAQLAGVENPGLDAMPAVLAKSDQLPSFWVTGPVIGKLLKAEGQIQTVPPIAVTYDASFVDALAHAK
ncbi:MAG TPA: ABC transporter substrate-binding protein [Acidocella sp.]|jgi:NitT/TauT family transport system substrate-binding protein|uniref:ABC transporter substrate-binding protein n=1 Tax=Acidocella sp. TaxID=50710 RepID=UPI002BA0C075|nr:ABC transporter substrate-binding protein [Acidocella sp.]HVE23064.1 ABC transporter substrate-binding protein [Acidocella sp.]